MCMQAYGPEALEHPYMYMVFLGQDARGDYLPCRYAFVHSHDACLLFCLGTWVRCRIGSHFAHPVVPLFRARILGFTARFIAIIPYVWDIVALIQKQLRSSGLTVSMQTTNPAVVIGVVGATQAAT